jgi:hypothetical protein
VGLSVLRSTRAAGSIWVPGAGSPSPTTKRGNGTIGTKTSSIIETKEALLSTYSCLYVVLTGAGQFSKPLEHNKLQEGGIKRNRSWAFLSCGTQGQLGQSGSRVRLAFKR